MVEERECRRNILKLMIVISVLMVTILIAGCSKGFVSGEGDEVAAIPLSVSPVGNPTNGMVKSSDGGAVTIDVEWHGEENNSLVFYVTMNTHSVDLDQYDLGELTVLYDSEGTEYSGALWESAPGGHHRQGILHFPLPNSLSQGKTEYIEIVIRDVAGIKERAMKWEF